METRQIVINNLLVNYYVAGNERAVKTVVFLHGWRSEGRVWGPVIRALEDKYNIYALDLPGFGRSEAPKKPFTVGDYAGIVEEFIEKVVTLTPTLSRQGRGGEIENFPSPLAGEGLRVRGNTVLVGHSFGGRVAIKLAATRPDLVHKLVLVDSAGIRVKPPAKLLKNTVAKILKPLFNFGFMRPLRAKLYRVIGAEDYVATPELREIFLNVINEDLTPSLSKINVPTLILWGEGDIEVSVEQGKLMNSLIPNSKFIILPKAGHFSFLDKQEEFVRELKDFVAGTET